MNEQIRLLLIGGAAYLVVTLIFGLYASRRNRRKIDEIMKKKL